MAVVDLKYQKSNHSYYNKEPVYKHSYIVPVVDLKYQKSNHSY